MARFTHRKALLGSAALLSTFAVGGGVVFAAADHGTKAVRAANDNTNSSMRADWQVLRTLRQDLLTELAQELNLTPAVLHQDLQDGKTIAQLASQAGVSTSTLVANLENKAASDLQADVASGALTSEQASHLESRVDRAIQAWVNGKWPAGWDKVRPRGMGAWRRDLIATAAQDLHLSTSSLIADLRKGQTLAEIAAVQGVSTSTLISDLENAAQADIQQAVSDGKISASEAQAMSGRIDTWITDWVNGTLPHPSGAHLPGAQPTSSTTAINTASNT
ncbi:hypothetical protein [Alicyclobacillus acidocaldarius]|uniref:Uncharacterized protein n=1 Tax=Alicyclobacillus acidocaldarius subsp. acidocaldarius (strain ATCC 27009 / DSM 446 / BCRC 14685 / JCM 5260 / KCTC 1825 / NBRC 15652 / NCIMB 11725 / NRRL B-14509 / 104-IA) TaxID=521098 RepID=C8WVG7_ALIAD|nr:hypothetical protein [Alicyclobacillus acidocaldarius]ACV58089.1 hypothetical protein Aaci_1051 [Alicyclobacillus acidocaldarius subsp. acidocaldarius DSM 446]